MIIVQIIVSGSSSLWLELCGGGDLQIIISGPLEPLSSFRDTMKIGFCLSL